MAPRPRFGRYVAVDWSARSTPASGPDSIWIAVLDHSDADPVLHNPRTRAAAAELLTASPSTSSATLVGVDAGLGYPSGTARLFRLDDADRPWRAMWRRLTETVADDHRNTNNRFDVAAELNRCSGVAAGPFWGCPPGRASEHLQPTKPAAFPLAEFRDTELALRAAGRSPMSMWQLTGAGSVGSQSLTAIPVLQRWCDALGERAVIWPFTCGFREPDVQPGTVVVAEVWPTQFDPPYPSGAVWDAAQVAHVARRLRSADRDGTLTAWFAPPGVSPAVIDDAIAEQGWVLGP